MYQLDPVYTNSTKKVSFLLGYKFDGSICLVFKARFPDLYLTSFWPQCPKAQGREGGFSMMIDC